jgi:integrase
VPRKKNPTKQELAEQISTYKKTGSYKTKKGSAKDQKVSYNYFEASWEVPKEFLPSGASRRRLTARGESKEEAKWTLVTQITNFLKDPSTHWLKTHARGASLDAYISEKWVRKLRSDPISETVKRRHLENYKNHIQFALGNKSITTITTEDLQQLIHTTLRTTRTLPSAIRKDGERVIEGLGEATRKNVYSTLSKLFRSIYEDKLIVENPMKYVSKVKVKKQDEKDLDRKIEKVSAMMTKIQDHPDYCRFLLQFLGLRRAERLGLTWDDVRNLNTSSPYIVVANQLARYETPEYEFSTRTKSDKGLSGWYIKAHTKTNNIREIPLPPKFAKALRVHRKNWEKNKLKWDPIRKKQIKAHQDWEASGRSGDEPLVMPPLKMDKLLFLKPNGELITLNRDNEDWANLLAKHKIEKFRAHLMRHATASMLAESNTQLSEIYLKTLLGHESTAMSYYYTKLHHRNMKKAMSVYEKSLTFFKD